MAKRSVLLDMFTRDELIEIYYALESKAMAIKAGQMGPEERRGEDKRWIRSLKEIMAKISNEVDV